MPHHAWLQDLHTVHALGMRLAFNLWVVFFGNDANP